MQLRHSPTSPFVRKVRIAAAVLGLDDRITLVPADTGDPDDPLRAQNPLGKVPALILGDGTAVYDSLVIVDYLDGLSDAAVLIPPHPDRTRVLVTHSLADGICEAGLLQVFEKRMRPEEKWHQPWLDNQAGKVARALDTFEASPPPQGGTPDVGTITLACALGYLDLRFEGAWRQSHPGLAGWLETFSARVPAFAETAPPTG